ncbi:integrator complex subunit 2 [Zopfochytrium polystomum]|nr:integrator complex subunit 2 [Zopfochytrium polystomum]
MSTSSSSSPSAPAVAPTDAAASSDVEFLIDDEFVPLAHAVRVEIDAIVRLADSEDGNLATSSAVRPNADLWAYGPDVEACLLRGLEREEMPIDHVITVLLFVDAGPGFVGNWLDAQPFLLDEVMDVVTRRARDPRMRDRCAKFLLRLAETSMETAMAVRTALLRADLLLEVTLRVAVRVLRDEVIFLEGVLANRAKQFLAQAASMLDDLRDVAERLCDRLTKVESSAEACSIVRVLCGLTGVFRLQLPPNLADGLLDVLGHGGLHCSCDRLTKLKLCLLVVACETFNAEATAAKFMRCLSSVVETEFSEITLMIAVFCYTQQLLEIEKIIRSVVGFTVSPGKNGLFLIRTIFTTKLFDDTAIAKRSLLLNQSSLAHLSNSRDELPHIVVYQLLKANFFQRTGVDIRHWVFQNIVHAKLPLSATLINIIKLYADSVASSSKLSRISDAEILKMFPKGAKTQPCHVLLVFYALYLNQQHLLLKQKDGAEVPDIVVSAAEYTDKVMQHVPINQILLHIEKSENQKDYHSVYPTLMSLVTSQYPHYLHVASFLQSENDADRKDIVRLRDKFKAIAAGVGSAAVKCEAEMTLNEGVMQQTFKALPQSTKHATLYLDFMDSLDPVSLLPYLDAFSNALAPAVLDSRVPAEVTTVFARIFRRFHGVCPREVWVKTINVWRLAASNLAKHMSYQDLVQNPLIAFQCDDRIFARADIFRVFLQILECLLIASRHFYYRCFQTQIFPNQGCGIREAHLHAMLDLQETAVIQTLLEVCAGPEGKSSYDGVVSDQTELDRVRHAVCFFVHQTFISSTKYMKLLHFQGYPPHLIPLLVSKVPSMHVCFEFIPELVAQPQLDKQLFGVQLASALVDKYPLPASHALTIDVILPKIIALARQAQALKIAPRDRGGGGGGDPVADIYPRLCASLVNLARGFPSLVPRVMDTLMAVVADEAGREDVVALRMQTDAAVRAILADPSKLNKAIL